MAISFKIAIVLSAYCVFAVCRKRAFDKCLNAVGPADFHFLDFSARAQPKMRERSIERAVPATGFDLPHLVQLALRPIMDDHPAPDTKSIAFAIPQFKNHTAVAGLVVAIHFERTVQGIGYDIQIAIVVDINIRVGGAMIEILQTKLLLSCLKRFTLLIMKKIIGSELLGDQYAIDHVQILPLVIVQIGETRIPTPLRSLHLGVL